ncbi:GyrI-like domain-containing protein [Pseudonocardia thermophila]|uniref:GyrI-like domain-containing protein n=1 Tax=Pseudonocardia thermophila TaxID=1848 RepID=UPI00248F013A|nr:GyrI-like domain-containing protein [Pseudonocardia thermophila]
MTTSTSVPDVIDIPARDVLTVDGAGAPESPEFGTAIQALYAVRAALGDLTDVPLEGTYTQGGDPAAFDLDAPQGWQWRLAVPAPAGATEDAVAAAAAPFGVAVRLRHVPAQRVARLLHHGPYSAERPALEALRRFVAAQGRTPAEGHTEVYLTDPSTVPPEELRTWLQLSLGDDRGSAADAPARRRA